MATFQRIGLIFLCVFLCQVVARSKTHDSVVSPKAGDNTQQNGGHDSHQNPQCQALAQHIEEKRIGLASIVPSIKIHDAEMDICYQGKRHPHHKTCCSRQLERQFHSTAVDNFMSSVQTTTSFLVGLLEKNSQHYQDMFVKMIQAAQNSTESLFDEVYNIPVRQRHGPISSLFVKLQAYVKLEDVDLHESMGDFWNDIFPPVFQHIISDLGDVRLSEDYKLCLTQLREELAHPPFGDPAQHLTRSISKSLSTAKFYLRALNQLLDTLNTTSRMRPEHQCSKTMTRMSYCALCGGELEALPCPGYCLNVMRGCLASISDLDKPWNSLVDQLSSLTTNMRGIYNIETVMSTVHHRVSEAIMHSMEVGPKIYPKILAKCGKPEDDEDTKTTSSKKKSGSDHHKSKSKRQPDSSTLKTFWDEHDPELHSKIENFMRSLKASQGFYSSLPDAVCTRHEFSSGVSSQCWNGETVDRYNKTVPENLLPEQRRSNPEVKVATVLPEQIQQLKTDLIDLSEELSHRAMSEMETQSDSYSQRPYKNKKSRGDRGNNKGRSKEEHNHEYGSGYGYGYGYQDQGWDDEDYTENYDDEWSGSGSGYGSDDEDSTHHHYRTGGKGKPNQPENDEFEFENRGDDKSSPYITPDNPKQQNAHDDLGASAHTVLAAHSLQGLPILLTLLLILLRIRG